MNIFKLSGFAGLSLVALSTFNACTDYTPFDEADIIHREYSKNFFAKYGEFPADMNWDFSDAPRTAPTDPSIFDLGSDRANRAFTRAHSAEATEEIDLTKPENLDDQYKNILTVPTGTDPYYYLEVETFDWLKNNLAEGVNNTPKGSPFVFRYETPATTDQKFAIIPFYQGYGNVKYKLHMVSSTQDKDYVIWDNWPLYDGEYTLDAVNQLNAASQGTADFQYDYLDNYPAPHNSGKWINVGKDFNLENLVQKNIRSKPMIISGLTGEFYFYLEVTQTLPQYASVGDHQSSKEGMMLAVNCPVPENINNYKSLLGVDNNKTITQTMVIGCEDSEHADWDINDIVFLVVGLTDLPQKIERKHSKRYLFEDMGTTVDFDFNDVVVDVTETVVINSDGTDGEVLAQEAVLRHKCGTVPFQVYFCEENSEDAIYSGAGSFDYMQGHVQGQSEQYTYFDDEGVRVRLVYIKKGDDKNKDNVNYKQVGSPFWFPTKNNIRINVGTNGTLTGQDWKDGNGGVNTISFERPGSTKAPYIIAVPTTVMWTSENQDFPINEVSNYNKAPEDND